MGANYWEREGEPIKIWDDNDSQYSNPSYRGRTGKKNIYLKGRKADVA